MFHTLSSRIPVELIDHIVHNINVDDDLCRLLLVNSVFFEVTARTLYNNIRGLSPSKSVLLLQTLSSSDKYSPFVRELELDWTECLLTGNIFRLLNRALRRLYNLNSLTVDNYHIVAQVFEGCKFTLQRFTTTIPCDGALASFLASQPDIRELCLRGFHTPKSPLVLPPTSLPRLNHFRALHARPSNLAEIVRGRPVECVSLAMLMEETSDSLNALTLSSLPIKRLSIMFFDSPIPAELFPQITSRMPDLEALHIVVLIAEYTMEILKETAPLLGEFKKLKYITFVAAGNPPSAGVEQDIALLWHRSCPTLRTIILPNGAVWFQRAGIWLNADENDDTSKTGHPHYLPYIPLD